MRSLLLDLQRRPPQKRPKDPTEDWHWDCKIPDYQSVIGVAKDMYDARKRMAFYMLDALKMIECSVKLDGDTLWVGPPDKLDDWWKLKIREYKPEIIQHLKEKTWDG